MNNYRNQRRDIRRALKTMKFDESKIQTQKLLEKSINKTSSKEINYRTITIDSQNKKSQQIKKKTGYRYGPPSKVDTENNLRKSQGITPYNYQSVELKDHKFLKINSKSYEKQRTSLNRDDKFIRNRFSSYLTKPSRKSSQVQRLKTYEIYRPQNNRHHPQILNRTNEKIFSETGKNLQTLLNKAEDLFANGQFTQCVSIAQKILSQNNESRRGLYLSAMSYLGIKKYSKALSFFNKLIQLDPTYNRTMYIVSSICYLNIKSEQQAIKRINVCLSHFPDYFDAYLQQAKIYVKTKNYNKVILSLKKGLKLNPDNYEATMILANAYQQTDELKLALSLYQKIIQRQDLNEHGFTVFLLKGNCQKKLQRYTDQIESLQAYIKYSAIPKEICIAQFKYEIAQAYYHLGDYPNALMNAQQIFPDKNVQISTKAIILISVVHIETRDYYEAYHTMMRKQHIEILQSQIDIYEKFCEGVINLMKRKFEVGLHKLEEITDTINQSPSDPFKTVLREIFPMYLSYALFCQGDIKKCSHYIKICLKSESSRIKIYRRSLEFNLKLCDGLLQYEKGLYEKAAENFKEAIIIYENKPEGYLYLAGCDLKLFLKHPSKTENFPTLSHLKQTLDQCIKHLKQLNNNYAACAYYFKACLSGYLEQWNDAINEIDQAIQRSEDNDPQSFYLRALILACCQNYKQAISDVSISISILDKQPDYYLLRSKCYQIEGDGNRAFMDLQTYIGLEPNDNDIHKYAGHLLFENGAFEDAIQAYENGQITQQPQNYSVFLTRAKTHFLLGNFQSALNDMNVAYKISPSDYYLCFDMKIIRLLAQFFEILKTLKKEDQKNIIILPQQSAPLTEQLNDILYDIQNEKQGKIFRKIQVLMIKGFITFYMGQYRQASRSFRDTCTLKQSIKIEEQDYEQEEKDKQHFISQMQYNRSICHLMVNEEEMALECLDNCRINPQAKIYAKLQELKNFIMYRQPNYECMDINFELFNQKNKISRDFNHSVVTLGSKRKIKLRLCIPFPKVQPPEISPSFELRLLQQIDILKIERKPEAPWVLRQGNSIKFTQKIERFSRLQLNNSEISKTNNNNKPNFGLDLCQDQDQSYYEQSDENLNEKIENLRIKLQLDQKIQQKLKNYIFKKDIAQKD